MQVRPYRHQGPTAGADSGNGYEAVGHKKRGLFHVKQAPLNVENSVD